MPRMYVVNSWIGCAEDSYSGEQVGNRNSKSVGLHMYRDGDQYKANLAAYADSVTDNKKQQSAYDKIMQDERKYDELEELSLALDKQYLDMQIDHEPKNFKNRGSIIGGNHVGRRFGGHHAELHQPLLSHERTLFFPASLTT